MGIQGLLKNLHPLLVPPPPPADPNNNGASNRPPPPQRHNPAVKHNIRQFAGKSLAIDASSWLHKAAYTCAERLVEATENGTRDFTAEQSYTKYMVKRCEELLSWARVDKVYLVFDGIRVPLKSGTNAEREAKRQANIAEARRLMSMGRRSEASERYKACAKGNEEMARVVAGAVERKWGKDATGTNPNVRVKCVWSPYEADAQLAKLCIDGHAHAVVTEDSDVLVYSAVTRRPFPIIYKLDRNTGSCDVVTMDWLVNPRFLAALNEGGGSSRRRRRMQRERDLDYIYNDSPLDEDEDGHIGPSQGSEGSAAQGERHPCEEEYDDLGMAPVRRALPLPTASGGGGRAKRRGSSGSEGAAGNAIFSYLRSFAVKEQSNPGDGVRLFVQACVLSGCDYCPSRLSKVGPVTSFRLVKEASHRDPADRFERVLKSLPNGSKLVAEAPAGSEDGENDGVNENGELDEFLSQPDNDRDAKEKYEELLSKSEAVFYYHLAKDLESGEIVPLVAHNSSESRADGGSGVGERYRPCTDRFEKGLEFVGSTTEALEKKLTPLAPLTKQGQGQYRRPAVHQQRNTTGAWLSTKKPNVNASHRQVIAEPPKETSLQRYFKGHQKKTSASVKTASTTPAMPQPPKEGYLLKYLNEQQQSTTSERALANQSKATAAKPAAKGSSSSKPHASSVDDTPATAKPDLFSAYAHAESTKSEEPKKKASKSGGRHDKAKAKSPFFSPAAKFDYTSNTPKESDLKPNQKSGVDDSNAKSEASVSKPPEPVAKCAVELFEGDEDDEGGEREQQKEPAKSPAEGGFDYSCIVEESPPIYEAEACPAGLLTKYIHNTKTSGSDQPGPRRVSTSPPKKMKSAQHSPEDVIELGDSDSDDDGPVASEARVDENRPNLSQSSTARMKASANKRQLKRPYPAATASGSKKRKTSSSALLAGFARQEKHSSSSSTGSGSRRKKSKFFPTTAKGPAKPKGKRPKGTPSLTSFLVPRSALDK
ncbi:hypothetical protein ACHAXT_004730 [Thalassiosira profunda]